MRRMGRRLTNFYTYLLDLVNFDDLGMPFDPPADPPRSAPTLAMAVVEVLQARDVPLPCHKLAAEVARIEPVARPHGAQAVAEAMQRFTCSSSRGVKCIRGRVGLKEWPDEKWAASGCSA